MSSSEVTAQFPPPPLAVATSSGWLHFDTRSFRCALGHSGVISAAEKREGDGCSPIGVWPIREIFFRADRLAAAPLPTLPCRPITPTSGWCDDPSSELYNTLIVLPCSSSHEQLWREDSAYDIIAVLGYNDQPPVRYPPKGSAIFLHCTTGDSKVEEQTTAGCIAVPREELLTILEAAEPGDTIEIRRE
jgi:L,D-peptidoglycan transpeptidase YkuD (ErfK/YbiS/YcfS/YnhG family)